jgi:hypothetical protein
VLNLLLRRMFLLTVALALCAPGLLADTFGPRTNPSRARLGGVFTGSHAVPADDHGTQTKAQGNQESQLAESKGSDADETSGDKDKKDQGSDYMTAAFLSTQMIGIDQSTAFGRLQTGLLNYALWGLFYHQPIFNHFGASQQSTAMQYLAKAKAAIASHDVDYSNASIWTRPKDTPDTSGTVRVPEPSVGSLVAFDALALAILGLFLRRRRIRLID